MLHWFGNVEELSSHNVKSGFTVRSMGVKALSALAVAAVVAAGGQAALATTTTQTTISPNWAGYADTPATGNTFNSVSASWNMPTVTPPAGAAVGVEYYASFWVGLDGFNSSTVEQVGVDAFTEKTATGVISQYIAFWEMFPAGPNYGIQVSAGDSVDASVAFNSTANTYTLSLIDTTSSASYSGTAPGGTNPAPQRSSAEWIAESPTITNSNPPPSYVIAPLANFGSITFTNATVDGSSITGFNDTMLNMATTSSELGATTSALSANGSSFTVTTAAPEPAALGLMSVGGLAILFGRRKRR